MINIFFDKKREKREYVNSPAEKSKVKIVVKKAFYAECQAVNLFALQSVDQGFISEVESFQKL